MNVSKNIEITLNDDEQETVRKFTVIIQEFANQDLCDNIGCYNCPFAMFCPFTDCAKSFEETLNDIANME